jgi:nucleoside-diphosphate-sugar epimerase
MQAVSLRPPLIYGAGVGGNFRRLIALAHKKRPLPLGGIQNRRSLIYVENFTSAIMAVLSDGLSTPQVLKPAYVLSDAAPYSTTDMMANILRAMGMPDQDIAKKLWPCPTKAVRFVANLLGKGAMVDRILGDLEVDPTDFQRDLNWAPPYKIAESFTRTIQGNMR